MLLALSATLALALATSAGAAEGSTGSAGAGGEQSLRIWAYFDGDTPLSGGRVRLYADGRQLPAQGVAGSGTRTFSDGTALLRVDSMPSVLRIEVTGGRAGGRPVRGSLTTAVRGVGDGDLVEVNPVTTVADAWTQAADGRSQRRGRYLAERTLGISRILDDADLFATNRWFDGDGFLRWALKRGSVDAGVRTLVRLIDKPGLDQRPFEPRDRRSVEPSGSSLRAPVGAGANAIIDELLNHIAEAASSSGPPGVLFGIALKGLKAAIADGINAQPEVNQVESELATINTRLAGLENQLKNAVFELKVEATRPALNAIDDAQRDLDWALSAKKPGWRPGDAGADKLTNAQREAIFGEATDAFLQKAARLDENPSFATTLHSLLIDRLPNGAPALIPGVRDKVRRAGRFFTNESSQEIDRFFDYYKLYEVRLATLLSEYYTLRDKPETAKNRVERIGNDYLPAQRRAMPEERLDPGIFIDTVSGLMWRTEPTFRKADQIPRYGIRCRTAFFGYWDPNSCDSAVIGARATFDDVSLPPWEAKHVQWEPPTAGQAQDLLAQRGGRDSIGWLADMGVTFDQRCPASGCRFPGYNPNLLEHPIALWLKDRYRLQKYRQGRWLWDPWKESIHADQLVLRAGPGWSEIKPPALARQHVAEGCEIEPAPSCKAPEPRVGAFFLWVRGPFAWELEQYW